ncbi:MAG: phage tail tube protein [Pseudomonadota bacterium]
MTIPIADLGLARENLAFVKLESAFGDLAAFVATDAVAALGPPSVSQPLSFSDSEEVVESRSLITRFRDKTPAGKWSLDLYSRPSGAAGTPPVEGVLLECLLGDKAVNAGVSVIYTPALALPSFSFASALGHTTRFAAGCLVESGKLSIVSKGGIKWSFSGPCRQVMQAGKASTVAGSTATVVKLEAGGAKLFDVGARVRVGDDTNTGAGYTVTAFDEVADSITVTPALASAPAVDVLVRGYLPTPTLAGHPLEGRLGSALFDAVGISITSADLTITNKLDMLEDEVTPDDFPSGYVPGMRSVKGDLSLYFLRRYLGHFRQAKNQADVLVTLGGGQVAGSILTVTTPKGRLDTPEISGSGDRLMSKLPYTALAGAGEDEISIAFT